MRCSTFCSFLFLFFCSYVANGQEYYRSISIQSDSVEKGTRLFHSRLSFLAAQSNEAQRQYRDSLAAVLINTDAVFANGNNTTPAALDTLLPRSSYRLINDLLWLNFRLSSDKATALSLLKVLAKYYPAEEFVQGNLSFAYNLADQPDSAIAVINRYLQLKPEGYSTLHVAASIINSSRINNGGQDSLHKILNFGAEPFQQFVQNKLYKFPANLDSLRNALANCILQRAVAVSAPDKVTGRLILDFADLTVKDKAYTEALPFYDLANIYDPALAGMVAERKSVVAEAEKSVSDTFKWASLFYAIPLISFVLILAGWLRSTRNIEKRTGNI